MKALIIDSNTARNRSLAANLATRGCEVYTMSMISMDNLIDFRPTQDVIVLLDQDPEVAREWISKYAGSECKSVLTNAHIHNEFKHIVVLTDRDIEQTIVDKIEALYQDQINARYTPIAQDPKSKTTLEIARKAAKSNATLLITGETGTGKEVLSHFIHYQSAFSKGPFISVNCAAMPENMIEAILFGYEKGAFTNAVNSYIGKFEQAQNGTLLLDEISEISIGLQAKLLRALQEKEIERLGGRKLIKVNVRIIAATNRDLVQQVNVGAFRKDLYYRLNVITIHCAGLRERRGDILPLAEHFVVSHAKALGRSVPKLSERALDKLYQYDWPGNIREMENVIQRALIMSDSDIISESDLHLADCFSTEQNDNYVATINQFDSKLAANEAKVIIDVLKETDGCRNSAARRLNISPRTLRYKLAKLRAIGLELP